MRALGRVRAAVAVAAAAFALRLLFLNVALPCADPHDENFHYAYAAFLAETGRIPKARELSVALEALRPFWFRRSAPVVAASWDRTAVPGLLGLDPAARRTFVAPNYQSQHPPLFYLPASGLLRVTPHASLSSRLFLLRMFATLCAVTAVPAAYRFFRHLLPRPSAILASAAFVTFPGVASLVGRFTNDALALPLAAMLLVLLVDLARGRLRPSGVAVLIAVLAAGCWTKLSFLPLLAAPILAAALAPETLRTSMLRRAVLASVLSAALFVPWLARQRADTGDWLGLTPSKTAASMHLGFRHRVAALPAVLRPRYWIVFGRTFLWAGTGTAQGAPAGTAVVLAAGLLALWLSPATAAGAVSPRTRRGALAAAATVALFVAAEILYSNTFTAVALARGQPREAYGLGWYAAILTPAILLLGCVFGRPVPRGALATFVLVSLAATWVIDLGVLPAVYSGRLGFNAANASFATYLRGLASPVLAMRTYSAAGLIALPAGLLALCWLGWQALAASAAGLGLARRSR